MVLFASCDKEYGGGNSDSPSIEQIEFVQLNSLQAGGHSVDGHPLPTTESMNTTKSKYAESQAAVDEGEQLFSKYNCTGCHGHGGGGSGVPLMDDRWIYGSQPDQIFNTIAEGRPNGMPCFGRKIPEDQIWRLVAFIRSLGGLTPGVQPTRKNSPLAKP